jgi:hypothetical protein
MNPTLCAVYCGLIRQHLWWSKQYHQCLSWNWRKLPNWTILYVIVTNLSGIQYTDFHQRTLFFLLREILLLLLEDAPLNIHEGMWFQHYDDALPHFSCQVHNLLNNHFLDARIDSWSEPIWFFLMGLHQGQRLYAGVQDCDGLIKSIQPGWLWQTLGVNTDNWLISGIPSDVAVKHEACMWVWGGNCEQFLEGICKTGC